MRADDFLSIDAADYPYTETVEVRVELLDQLRRGPLSFSDDGESAEALSRLLHRELRAYGSGKGWRIGDDDVALGLKALRATLHRLGISIPEIPFRDFTEFEKYWKQEGMKGSYQARRDYLDKLFAPLYTKFDELEEKRFAGQLPSPVSPRGRLDWPAIDREIEELRRRFAGAVTEQDCGAVGAACVRILESLGDLVYDPKKHLRDGEAPAPRDKTKQRFDRFIEVALPGKDNEELRKLAKATVEAAQLVKHRATPTRRDAGIAADAVILLANMLRRLEIAEASCD